MADVLNECGGGNSAPVRRDWKRADAEALYSLPFDHLRIRSSSAMCY
ncbi:hypothetical protein [Bradyrhizobium sp. CCGE-LA001]|nr:hypothetical protein [Bradyrhizobium sp. CCGE-LA001]